MLERFVVSRESNDIVVEGKPQQVVALISYVYKTIRSILVDVDNDSERKACRTILRRSFSLSRFFSSIDGNRRRR